MSEEIINRVAQSKLLSIDLEEILKPDEVVVFDLSEYLFQGLILREKDFRAALKALDSSVYENKVVAIQCRADAIVPMWANMLVVSKLQPIARLAILGTETEARREQIRRQLESYDYKELHDRMVVVKGCGNIPEGEFAMVEFTKRAVPEVRSLMFGEPCSTVPIYKKPREKRQPLP